MSTKDIKDYAASVGGVVALSQALGLSRGAVSQWKRVPAERVVEVEKITGIPREKLRPDIFGDASPKAGQGTGEEAA